MTTKNAYCPKAHAETLGLTKYWDNDGKGDMGKPAVKFTRKAADAFLSKAPQLEKVRITETTKRNTPGVTVADFLRKAAEKSEAQGYLSLSDLRDLAGIAAQVTPKVGHVAFRTVVNKLVTLGCLANVRGNKEKETVDDTNVDWSSFSLDVDDGADSMEIES